MIDTKRVQHIHIKVNADEKIKIQQAAGTQGLSVSAYIRQIILREINK